MQANARVLKNEPFWSRESQLTRAKGRLGVIEGGHHRGGGRCVRPQRGCDGGRATVAGTLAGSLQSWRSCAIMLSYTGACGRAGKRAGKMGGAEKEIDSACSSSSAAWSGGLCRRSKLCNGSAARATRPAFRRAQSAKALSTSNRVAATTREVCGRGRPRRRLRRASVVVASAASASAAYAVSAASAASAFAAACTANLATSAAAARPVDAAPPCTPRAAQPAATLFCRLSARTSVVSTVWRVVLSRCVFRSR